MTQRSGDSQVINGLSRLHRVLIRVSLPLFTVTVTLFWNQAFIRPWSLAAITSMNDVSSILSGYQHTQPLFPASLRWWHGSWIHEGVAAFRPLSSYLHWLDCWVGLHWGFLWTAWTGYALFLTAALLSTVLAWRLTGSVFCTFFAAGSVSLVRFSNAGQPDLWLAWFPVHHDLLMVSLLLAALLCFDAWFAGRGRHLLPWSWVFLMAGCLTKEFVYVFPLLAGVVSMLRFPGTGRSRQQGLVQAGLMLAAVAALWLYRDAVVPHPRDNHWGAAQLLYTPVVSMYSTLGLYLLSATWVVGLAALLLLLAGGVAAYRRSTFRETRRGKLLGRPRVWLPGLLTVLCLYLACASGSFTDAVWFFLDGENGLGHLSDLATMVFTFYSMFLIWKYRREEQPAASWLFLFLSCVPVLGFFGWHYSLPSYFFRAPYNALLLKLIWIELGRPSPSRMGAQRLWFSVTPTRKRELNGRNGTGA